MIHKRWRWESFGLCGVNLMATGEKFSPKGKRVTCPGCREKMKERDATAQAAFARAMGGKTMNSLFGSVDRKVAR